MYVQLTQRGDILFCPNCGKDVGDSKFCPECGTAVSDDAIIPVKEIYNGYVKVNKIAYALFAIFLGTLGIHRFYARRPLSGILYLLMPVIGILLSWLLFPLVLIILPGILGFFEGIVALMEEDDGNGNLVVIPGKYLV